MEGDEIFGTKRLVNGSKSIRHARDHVEIVCDGAIEELHLAKLCTDSMGSRLRLRRKAGVKSNPHIMIRSSKDDQHRHTLGERRLDDG